MANLKWDLHNWITVLLMVGVAWAATGAIKAALGGLNGGAPAQ